MNDKEYKASTKELKPAPRTMPERGDVIRFTEMREDGLIETNTWCTFGDIADFVMKQIEEKMYVDGIPQKPIKRR